MPHTYIILHDVSLHAMYPRKGRKEGSVERAEHRAIEEVVRPDLHGSALSDKERSTIRNGRKWKERDRFCESKSLKNISATPALRGDVAASAAAWR